jgi:hypothetical protein
VTFDTANAEFTCQRSIAAVAFHFHAPFAWPIDPLNCRGEMESPGSGDHDAPPTPARP